MDEVYLFVTKKIIFRYISAPIAWFDRHIVDGTMNSIASVTQSVSFRIRGFPVGTVTEICICLCVRSCSAGNIIYLFVEITDYQEKDF